jgi:hypothetical protein
MTSRYMIDTPSPFASLEAWEVFLAEIRDLPQDDEGVRDAIEEAEREIARKRSQT